MQKAADLQSKFNSGNLALTIELLNFLKDWVRNHIKGPDKKYIPLFKEKGLT